jgi:hypothetical protein
MVVPGWLEDFYLGIHIFCDFSCLYYIFASDFKRWECYQRRICLFSTFSHQFLSTASPPASLSSTWYCTGDGSRSCTGRRCRS